MKRRVYLTPDPKEHEGCLFHTESPTHKHVEGRRIHHRVDVAWPEITGTDPRVAPHGPQGEPAEEGQWPDPPETPEAPPW